MMVFALFCKSIVSPTVLKSVDLPVPEKYQESAKRLVEELRYRMTCLDKIQIPYIEGTLNDALAPGTALYEKATTGGDPDDSLPTYFAKELYGRKVEDCNQDEQAIIKVLASYILLQN